MKKSFILHIDSLSILDKMPDKVAGQFIKIIYQYQLTGELPEMDFALEMAITPFVNQFKRDQNKYENTVERNRINGSKGGRPKNPTKPKKPSGLIENPTKPKKADNDSDNDSKSINDSDNDNDNDKNKEIKKLLLSEIEISDVDESEIEYFEIAKAYQKLFIKNISENGGSDTYQKNAKYGSYVDPIRLMFQNDNVTKDQLQKVWRYLSSHEGDFWKSNILSTKKLRQKFSQLIIQANQSSKNGKQQKQADTFVKNLQGWN